MNNLVHKRVFYIQYKEGSNVISLSSSRKSIIAKTTLLLSAPGCAEGCGLVGKVAMFLWLVLVISVAVKVFQP